MKLFHLSDLHLGKRVNGFSMVTDQEYILDQILDLIREEKPDGVLIAGDVYDRPVPPVEAVSLLDHFLTSLMESSVPVFMVSGNHDSAERLGFGSSVMRRSGIRIARGYSGKVEPEVLEDEHGPVKIWLLPFLRPLHVRMAHPECRAETYTDAVREAIAQMGVDPGERNVVVAHQFVTGAAGSGSEDLSLGGTDNVDGHVFDGFDYVALGHIHRPQRLLRDTMRYSGTPLKYSFSECHDRKSVTVVELGEKGSVSVRMLPLSPLRDMREIRGTYMELTDRRSYEGTAVDDYLHITLTDEDDVLDAAEKLRIIYPNLMKMDYDNTRTRRTEDFTAVETEEAADPFGLALGLYEKQHNAPPSMELEADMRALAEKIWGKVSITPE